MLTYAAQGNPGQVDTLFLSPLSDNYETAFEKGDDSSIVKLSYLDKGYLTGHFRLEEHKGTDNNLIAKGDKADQARRTIQEISRSMDNRDEHTIYAREVKKHTL